MPKELSKKNSNLQHYNLVYGKWRIRSTHSNPNAVKRRTENGKDIYEVIYEALSGELKALEVSDIKHGKQLTIYLRDPEDSAMMAIHMDLYSFMGKSFLRRVENIEPNYLLRLAIYNIYDKDIGGNKDILSVYQDLENWTDPKQRWVAVKDKYPAWQGLPPVSEFLYQSKVLKDATARIETLLNNIERNFIQYIQSTPFRLDNRAVIPTTPQTTTSPGPSPRSIETPSADAPPPSEIPPYIQ